MLAFHQYLMSLMNTPPSIIEAADPPIETLVIGLVIWVPVIITLAS